MDLIVNDDDEEDDDGGHPPSLLLVTSISDGCRTVVLYVGRKGLNVTHGSDCQ